MSNVLIENNTMIEIADAIREVKNVEDTYLPSEMPDAIRGMTVGGDNVFKDAKQVYAETRPKDWMPMPVPEDNEIYMLMNIPAGVIASLDLGVICVSDYTVEMGIMEDGVFSSKFSESIEPGGWYCNYEIFATDFSTVLDNGDRQIMVKVSGDTITEFNLYSEVAEVSARCSACETFGISNIHSLKYCSLYELNITDMNGMFNSCDSLITTPEMDTVGVTNMCEMFYACRSLITIPEMDTSNVTDMSCMFEFCYSLITIPEMDTSNVTNMHEMFECCYSLITIPEMDTSNVTDMGYMFEDCYSLIALPEMDTSNVTDMYYMFGGCHSLTAVPQLDTSNVTDMGYMFAGCTLLREIPELDTSNVTNMRSMFSNCNLVQKIPEIDISNVTAKVSIYDMFSGCWELRFVRFKPVTGYNVNRDFGIDLSHATLGHAALVDLFNSLPKLSDLASSYRIPLTLTRSYGRSELSDEDIAIATNKGWRLVL